MRRARRGIVPVINSQPYGCLRWSRSEGAGGRERRRTNGAAGSERTADNHQRAVAVNFPMPGPRSARHLYFGARPASEYFNFGADESPTTSSPNPGQRDPEQRHVRELRRVRQPRVLTSSRPQHEARSQRRHLLDNRQSSYFGAFDQTSPVKSHWDSGWWFQRRQAPSSCALGLDILKWINAVYWEARATFRPGGYHFNNAEEH